MNKPPILRSRRRRLSSRISIFGAAAAVAVIALATTATHHRALAEPVTIDPLEGALDFNMFIENDTTLSSLESEGPLATGGNLILQGTYNVSIHSSGTFIDEGDTVPAALVVGGQVDFDQDDTDSSILRILNGGYAKVGDLTGTDVLTTDSNSASVNTRLVAAGAGYDSAPRVELTVRQPAESVGETSPIDFDAAFADFRERSATLTACPSNVTMRDASGAAVASGDVQPEQQITIELTDGQTNVLNLTGEDLDNMSNLTFLNQPSASAPLLINIDTSGSGGDFDWDVASQAGISGDQAPYILWNFDDTTTLTISGGDSVEGTIYAPNAAYTNLSPTNVEGTIIAESANFGAPGVNGGETHYFPFDAELTCDTDDGPSPSPTTDGPTSDAPTSDAPTSDAPTSNAPTSDAPTSDAPTSDAPTSDAPPSDAPTSDAPTSDEPTSGGPTSEAPTTLGPTSDGPATDGSPAASTDVSGKSLTTTGAGLAPLIIGAAVLIAAGAAALVANRRRRTE